MIKYGVPGHYVDITNQVAKLCHRNDNFSYIPETEEQRCRLFGDPIWGTLKHILVNDQIIPVGTSYSVKLPNIKFIGDPHVKLQEIHSNLKFTGNLQDEYPEQIMSLIFIEPNDRVLEIGSNIGRNTCVIASLLKDSSNLTTLETENRNDNNFHFKIINAALSKRPLWQKWWVTMPANESPGNDWHRVETIQYKEIYRGYNVLVADCEGALYYILQDFPELLDTIETIIVENDYRDPLHFEQVVQTFKDKNFTCRYSTFSDEAVLYNLPCHRFFFQVWQRIL
jgi:hypothetical protein